MGVPLSIVYVVYIIHGRTNLFSMTATISTGLIFTNSTRLHSTRNSLQSPGITSLAWHLLHSPGTQVASQNMRSQPASALMSYRARPLHSTHNFHFGVQNMILHNLCSGYRTTQYDWTEKKCLVLSLSGWLSNSHWQLVCCLLVAWGEVLIQQLRPFCPRLPTIVHHAAGEPQAL